MLLLLFALITLFTLPADTIRIAEGPPPKMVHVYELPDDHGIRIDGRMDEEVWQQVVPISDFVQREPIEGGIPTERTEVRMAQDGRALYIAVTAFDSEPDGILAYQRRRNAGLGTDDRFMWIIDTFGDGRTAYFFEINPAGLMGDGLLRTGQGGGVNKSWDGVWDVRTSRNDAGWSAEIRIPFRILNFDPDLAEWGVNFQRTIRRRNEELIWSGHRRNQGLTRPQNAGLMTGMGRIGRSAGLEVRPYAIANSSPQGTGADAGLDMSYSFTPNLRGAVSINTDFAEVEVDDRRVNLTRFPQSFPEQRDFFLQGSNIFSFASASGVTPFFSRRIGLTGGQPVPILAGARLLGQVAGTDVGLFQVRTAAHGEIPVEDFTAVRARRNVLRESSTGLVYTRRATLGGPDGPPDRHTLGADLDLETSRFLGNRNLQFQAFWVATSLNRRDEVSTLLDRSARGFRLAFPNHPWSGHVSYRELGEAYAPAVGFVSRNGMRRFQPTVQYAPFLTGNSLIRQISWSLTYEHLMDMDFRPLTRGASLTLFNIGFESGDRIWTTVSQEVERLDQPFRLLGREELTIPAGNYHTVGLWGGVQTASFRPVSTTITYAREGFWTGVRDRFSASGTFRPLAGVALSAAYGLNRIRLAEGEVDTHLTAATANVDLTPWTALLLSTQYDNVSEVVGFFGRFRWIVRPGTDVFLVYNHNWRADDAELTTLDRAGAAKVTLTQWF